MPTIRNMVFSRSDHKHLFIFSTRLEGSNTSVYSDKTLNSKVHLVGFFCTQRRHPFKLLRFVFATQPVLLRFSFCISKLISLCFSNCWSPTLWLDTFCFSIWVSSCWLHILRQNIFRILIEVTSAKSQKWWFWDPFRISMGSKSALGAPFGGANFTKNPVLVPNFSVPEPRWSVREPSFFFLFF